MLASYVNKKDFILKGLRTSELLDLRDFKWGFFDIELISDETGDYITGYLAKYKPTTEEEIAVEEIRMISWEEASRIIAAKSRFFLHVYSGLIAYHPIARKISRSQFCKNFCELFEMSHKKFFVNAEIQSINEHYKIFEVLKEFELISKVSFYIHPLNPRSGIWKDVDDRLKRINVASYKEEYISKENEELNIIDDEDFENKLNMAADGYGEARIKGRLYGETKVVTTHDNPVSSESKHEDSEPADVLIDLRKTIQNIFNRFKDDKN